MDLGRLQLRGPIVGERQKTEDRYGMHGEDFLGRIKEREKGRAEGPCGKKRK